MEKYIVGSVLKILNLILGDHSGTGNVSEEIEDSLLFTTGIGESSLISGS